jgi:hypothetical protein
MLQMDGLKRVEIDTIERTEQMSDQHVGFGTGKDVIVRELVNEPIKVQMEET